MTNKWEFIPIIKVCEDIFAGGDVPKNSYSKERTSAFSIPIYTNGEKNKGLYGYTNVSKVTKPSVTISARGTIGYPVIRNEAFYPAIRLIVAIPKTKLIDISFFRFFLDTLDIQFSGTSIPQLTVPMVKSILVPIPPLPEQKRIVAILDEAFAGIARAKEIAEKNLANARAVFDSFLRNIVQSPKPDWDSLTLEQVSKDFGRGKSKHRPRNDPKLYNGKYPFIQTGDIRNSNHLIIDYSQTYNDTGLAQSKLWPKGTLCITIAANIAETGILDFDSCFPDSVIGLVPNPKVADVHFIEYLLKSFKSVLQAKGKGSAQDNINLATFENEKFPFPPLKEQKLIVEKLSNLADSIKKLESIYRQKLASLEELKKSLLHQAFSGALTGGTAS